ncbi:NADH-dependent [FeFe] hydrogenase, group A6 [Clostridium senegalense]|uniref:4Fe-4S dicluster domain-containing protein n=1 Tax=Clostridium senegalense TaxID=1465809 RepID=A0A6M0H1M1_9CLOT|nr:NADH-dependent [FeFe] hydrogenase, group A6 [Clostridium senegalense]NEU04118.1 4Fe-4S dicluster domain-containing protein [Clostridium senegalense]
MINLKINNIEVSIENGKTILDACKKANIKVPTLCNMKMIDNTSQNCKGTCRVCMVELKEKGKLVPACSELVRDGMDIITNSTKVLKARKTIVELLLSNHPNECLVCNRNENCELRKLAGELGISKNPYKGKKSEYKIDCSSPALIRDMNKCVLCRRCVTACDKVQNINILTPINRGFNTKIGTFFDNPINETKCTYCGQCVAVCPTGALTEVMDYEKIPRVVEDKEKFVVAQIAPAVRVALCEEFGVSSDIITTGKIVAALKMLNFNKVFDTNFSADLTIMEEAKEFINRFKEKNKLPLITSCCPAWIRFAEMNYKDNLKYISSCKSPQQMFGAIAKSYLVDKYEIKKENMVVVSIMPCIAKKYEAKRKELKGDVDIVITTRELAKLIRESSIDIINLKEEEFDNPLGVSTGAGMLFGTSGGVMEAALRTAYEWSCNKTLNELDFKDVRGLDGIKEATIELDSNKIEVAVISSLKNAKKIMEEVKSGTCKYDFIEIMACPGGCIDGGGQPYIKSCKEKLEKRMKMVYEKDKTSKIRKSHENPIIKELYKEFLNEDNIKQLLHVTYN